MVPPRRRPAFTIHATRSSMHIARSFASGILFSRLVQQIGKAVALQPTFQSSGGHGGRIPKLRRPTRSRIKNMCTVTFIAQRKGYCLGMNRDEKLTRAPGLPPTQGRVNGREVICPSEPTGGTWISLNDAGVCFALINWYSVTDRVKDQPISRGEVVKTISGATLPGLADEALNTLSLEHLNPFRLIGIFPATNQILEWNWDLKRTVRKKLPWKTRQWISSGLNEAEAQRIRGETFR